MTCIITVYDREFDVEAYYERAGFAVLPPQLTMSGWALRVAGQVDNSYTLSREFDLTPIEGNQSVPVSHGDVFVATPQACSGGSGT